MFDDLDGKVTHKVPWLALHPTNKKLLAIYEDVTLTLKLMVKTQERKLFHCRWKAKTDWMSCSRCLSIHCTCMTLYPQKLPSDCNNNKGIFGEDWMAKG